MPERHTKQCDADRRRIRTKAVIIAAVYLVIWTVLLITFWTMQPADAMGYALLAFYLVLPVTTLVLSVAIGRDDAFGRSRWLVAIVFGVFFFALTQLTFTLANILSNPGTSWVPELEDLLGFVVGAGISLVGIAIGRAIRPAG